MSQEWSGQVVSFPVALSILVYRVYYRHQYTLYVNIQTLTYVFVLVFEEILQKKADHLPKTVIFLRGVSLSEPCLNRMAGFCTTA
jgi:hypothetical protein